MIAVIEDDVVTSAGGSQDLKDYAAAHREIEQQERTGVQSMPIDQLGHRLIAEFTKAELDRRETEQRWLQDLRQFKGKYDPDVEAAIGKRSKAFVRKTRVKLKTVNSRVADLLFPAGSEKNWTIDPTPKPNIDSQERTRIAQAMAQMAQESGQQVNDAIIEQAIVAAAKESSKRMSTTIDDQLTEARYKEESLKAINNCHLYGTGILKGPLVERKIRTRFKHEVIDEPATNDAGEPLVGPDGMPLTRKVQRWAQYSESYVVPFVESVPLWNFYPDMSVTSIEDCHYVYELHPMPRHKLAELANRPTFNKKRVINYLNSNPNGCSTRTMRDVDNELKSMGDRNSTQVSGEGKYDVLERWGWISGKDLRECGIEISESRLHESFFANIWMLPDGQIIRSVLQPINGITWPYYFYYFDKDETSIFGEGLSTIMRDDQSMLNAAVRMMLDNAAISAGPQIEVATDLISNMENMDEIIPWRIWKRNSSKAGGAQRAISVIDMPSHLPELSNLATMFENNADETTAIPRYMSGENATQGAAGTAAGMSMLMAAANIVIKDLITSWDEGVMRPFITALYHWNMQFNSDNTIKGDYDVKARGTASLVAKEVRARQLNEFAAMASDPQDAPFIKRHKLLQARAEVNELSDVIKSEDEVKSEQQSEEAQKSKALQQQLAEAQVAEAVGKAKRLEAEVSLSSKKLEELDAKIKSMATGDMVKKVEAVFAALQAGGVATRDPLVAPAADEILRSTGFVDYNGDPSVAELNGPPVQPQENSHVLLNRGQSVVIDPRAMQPQGQNLETPQTAEQLTPDAGQPASIDRPTGMVGRRAGIQTERIDG